MTTTTRPLIRYHATTTVRDIIIDILVDCDGVVIAGTEDHALVTGIMCDEKGDGRCYIEPDDYDHNGVTAAFGLSDVEDDFGHGEVLEDLTDAIDAALCELAYADESYLTWLYRYDDDDDTVPASLADLEQFRRLCDERARMVQTRRRKLRSNLCATDGDDFDFTIL